jgi:hypothetical protein
MRIVVAIIALICGIAVLAGIFLPWAEASRSILGVHVSYSLTGLNIMDASGWDLAEFALPNNLHAVLALVGAASMIVAALSALVSSIGPKMIGRAGAVVQGLLIIVSSLVAIGGLAWFCMEMHSKGLLDYLGYGVYICGGGAVLGLIFGILASEKQKFKSL